MSDARAQPPAQPAPAGVTWPDAARAAAFSLWLGSLAQAHRLVTGSLRLASADASFRRYLRLDQDDGGSLIVMDAPPAQEDCRPFVRVAGLMREAGLKVPQVLSWDQANGFLLLTDLGSRTLIDTLDTTTADRNRSAFMAAIDALIAWQRASQPGVLPAYDRALLLRELQLFPDWYLARHRGVTLDAAQSQVLAQAFERIVDHNLAAPAVYVHRDFMPRNLMPGAGDARMGENLDARMGVLDFQDAVYGPITYDIASLLRDAFISWDEEFVLDITVRYWQAAQQAGLPVDADFGEFWRQVEWMGLQRHLKVAGIFARLTLRDGKPRYLADTPRFIGYIRATCARYRELGPLLRLVDQVEGTAQAAGYAFGRI